MLKESIECVLYYQRDLELLLHISKNWLKHITIVKHTDNGWLLHVLKASFQRRQNNWLEDSSEM